MNVTVSGVPENPLPVIVSWFPEIVVPLIVEAEATDSRTIEKMKMISGIRMEGLLDGYFTD